jgi:hypothetical protein
MILSGCGRETGEVTHVIYSGYVAGYLDPCPCPEGRVGGLSRFARAVQDSLQRWKREALLIDAGEWADPYVLPGDLKNGAILEAFTVLDYDAINVCGRDLIAGREVLLQAAQVQGLPFISANLVDTQAGEKLFPPWIIRDIGGINVAVIGLGDNRPEDLHRAGLGHLEYLDYEEALTQALAEIGEKCDFIILLCDFSARIARGLGVKFPAISVIISSRDLLPTRNLNRSGPAYVLGSSRRGVRLTSFSLIRPQPDSLACRFSEQLLRDDAPTHPQIEQIISKYKAATAVLERKAGASR